MDFVSNPIVLIIILALASLYFGLSKTVENFTSGEKNCEEEKKQSYQTGYRHGYSMGHRIGKSKGINDEKRNCFLRMRRLFRNTNMKMMKRNCENFIGKRDREHSSGDISVKNSCQYLFENWSDIKVERKNKLKYMCNKDLVNTQQYCIFFTRGNDGSGYSCKTHMTDLYNSSRKLLETPNENSLNINHIESFNKALEGIENCKYNCMNVTRGNWKTELCNIRILDQSKKYKK